MRSTSAAAILTYLGLAIASPAIDLQRLGHTTLIPRHSSPDDKGMYAAAIDPANGYAYFLGSWLFKLDITGNLPMQVGPSLNISQSTSLAIDSAAGYLYQTLSVLDRYSVGAGTNAVSSAGSLALTAGTAQGVLIDDSDPYLTNHFAYVLCSVSGNPGRVTKVALATFTEVGFVSLASGETNGVIGHTVDPKKGYAYFVLNGVANTTNSPRVVKIKMTPGTNLPVYIGSIALDTNNVFIDGGSIDTVHGYVYYGTYDSDTNTPGKVYKVKLEEGDVKPTLIGHINLRAGEGRLSASVCDPTNGFVYFANDNTYPGAVVQLNMNGTNLPIEVTYLPLQGGPDTNTPPNGITASNTTTNADGILPYGEVFIRSAVLDPVRGFAYLGQDSRPNQIVKLQLAQINPFSLAGAKKLNNGSFQFGFTNIMGAQFSASAATNISLPLSNWSSLGSVTDSPPGQYQFTDPGAATNSYRFYKVRSP
ncbi:MAG: hypothetical protein C5B50_08445 [Verrucomicrobia bacterium]|nr:MAG: hypothetical protein C5B50_08445 [Verrucomicrobiota bacterium]